MMRAPLLIPAKAGISWRHAAACCAETPAFAVPAKYYFAGRPFAGVTEGLAGVTC
jgi:hypothetical protein